MKLLFIWLLYACSVIFCSADYSFAVSEHKIYMPFRERTLMTEAWRHVKKHASQEKRDHLLYEFARIACSDQDYCNRRKEIAAAIFAGACVAQVQKKLQEVSYESLLPKIVLKGDLPLVHLLLVNGADINEVDLKQERAIYHAKTTYMAILLIKYKALDDLHDAEKLRIFERIMWHDYEAALIKLYKGHGFNPASWENSSLILRSLICNPNQNMVKKAAFIFDKMSCEDVLKIISGKRIGSAKTISDEIKLRQATAQPDARAQLAKLQNFLSDLIECPICLESMDTKSYAKTPCGHIFHRGCLYDWKAQCITNQKNNQIDCPTCRKIM